MGIIGIADHIIVCPPHDGPGWRAIFAGMDEHGNAIVIPVEGFYGKLTPRTIRIGQGANGPSICKSADIRAIHSDQLQGKVTYCGRIDGDIDAAEDLARAVSGIAGLQPRTW